MRGGKGIVDENVAEFGQGLDEGRIVLRLCGMKSRIFKHEDIALAHCRDRALCNLPHAIEAKAT